jgi:hypothetical protein
VNKHTIKFGEYYIFSIIRDWRLANWLDGIAFWLGLFCLTLPSRPYKCVVASDIATALLREVSMLDMVGVSVRVMKMEENIFRER